MVDIIVDEAHKLCVSCDGGVVMQKLAYLNEVFQCTLCSGFEYVTPYTQNNEVEEEEEQYFDPGALVKTK